jgi:hypothetical protein
MAAHTRNNPSEILRVENPDRAAQLRAALTLNQETIQLY